ncbi:MAG: tail fiber domain-containing protein [Solirubrobacterales bacterium]
MALFLALAGTASAAVAPPNSVVSSSIKDGEVKNPDLGTRSVTAAKVVPDTLTATQIKESTLDFTVLQKRIAGFCPIGKAVRLIRQDGSVACQKVPGGTVKSVATGTGLSGGPITTSGTIQLVPAFRLPQACSNGQVAKWNGSSWACGDAGGVAGWSLSGNAGTSASNFLGTTDSQPLNLRVNDARALRLEPASDGTNQSPNVIGGIADNAVTPGVHAATIAGGGRGDAADAASANRVTDNEGTVGGGANNQAGDGAGTLSDRPGATVGGGLGNTAGGEHATIGGGIFNTVNGTRATVAGGQFNGAAGNSATVAGGSSNSASGDRAFVGAGNGNLASGQGSAVGGGEGNHATGGWATVPGGNQSTAQGDLSLAAGLGAQANDNGSFVWADSNPFFFPSTAQNQFDVRSTGGVRLVSGITAAGSPASGLELPANTSGWSTLANGQPFDIRVNGARGLRVDPASDGSSNPSPNLIGGSPDNSVSPAVYSATIGGGGRDNPINPGSANRVTDNQGTVAGGADNQAGNGGASVVDGFVATVGGGHVNIASGARSTVGGGELNTASGDSSTVAGGNAGTASGNWSTVPGGLSNTALGSMSLAAGRRAKANDQGAFVWADSSNSDFASTAPNEFSVRSTGGARFVSAVNAGGAPTAGVQLAPGGGSWSSLSDRNSKRAIKPVSGRRVLRKLASVPVSTWSYRAQDDSIRHIGPMAQDFYRTFGVGEDRRHIDSIDADGVALAAIKGLNRQLRVERRRTARLRMRVSALEDR